MPSNRIELDQPTVIVRDGQTIIRIPMKLRRMGGRKKIIVPDGLDSSSLNKPLVQQPLAIAVARAHRWKDLLERGRFDTLGALASALGLDNSYAARILRLTLLAPDIIEAILEGREPSGTSLEQLTKPLPSSWQDQRVLLGF